MKSLKQEFINAWRGEKNKFKERSGIDHKLITCQAAFYDSNELRPDWILTNGETIEFYLLEI